jgi:hypothetical protein
LFGDKQSSEICGVENLEEIVLSVDERACGICGSFGKSSLDFLGMCPGGVLDSANGRVDELVEIVSSVGEGSFGKLSLDILPG